MLIVVVDLLDSALGKSAAARQASEKSIILEANKFNSPKSLICAIRKHKPSIVLFSFRQAMVDILSLRSSFEHYKILHQTARIGVLVPDCLDMENDFDNVLPEYIRSLDFLLTTNYQLKDFYISKVPVSLPVQIYHDLVDVSKIKLVRPYMKKNERSLIWIGNSKWGKRQGKRDHKGFHNFVKPLMSSNSMRDWEFKVIDSAYKSLPYIEVLEKLANCKFLLQTSDSEGTSLPILEASLLGTIPITTNVGIANELLGDDFKFLIVQRDLKSIESALKQLEGDLKPLQIKLIEISERYLAKISQEKVPRNLAHIGNSLMIITNMKSKIMIKLKWIYRYLVRIRI
jgi:glycosyltransferase involved in cell wall biosynthesis